MELEIGLIKRMLNHSEFIIIEILLLKIASLPELMTIKAKANYDSCIAILLLLSLVKFIARNRMKTERPAKKEVQYRIKRSPKILGNHPLQS
jgi:hypothetical protein